jgi:ParB family chromosome partitioning protein
MQVQAFPMDQIDDDPELNCRGMITPIDVVDLAKDIKVRGLIQPIVIAPYDEARKMSTGKTYRILAGFRRFMAHKVNSSMTIDASLREMTSELEALTFNLSENIQREDLDILQEANAIRKLRDFGLTEDDAGKQLGKSRGWIQVRFMLLGLPEDVQKEAKVGLINQQNIRDLYTIYKKTGSADEVYEAVRTLKDQKLRGQARRITVKSNRTKQNNQKRHRKRPEVFEMMETVRLAVGNGLHTRALAWAAGEISDLDFYTSIKDYANEMGIDYIMPTLEN